ncbi:hypothetical protein [Halomonas colorata]|uniref:hypothetical protein n=1 Tax=Halomonas colorata TaxID=2742615 RepID=UPI0018687188|nr:hypothetical protein [Halomonas colorata]
MIDTIAFAERLKSEGFTEQQARHLARLEIEREERIMTKNDLANLATKQDIADVKVEMADMKSELKVLKWGMGIVIAAVLIPALRDLLSLIG